jgi:hypothetical protein
MAISFRLRAIRSDAGGLVEQLALLANDPSRHALARLVQSRQYGQRRTPQPMAEVGLSCKGLYLRKDHHDNPRAWLPARSRTPNASGKIALGQTRQCCGLQRRLCGLEQNSRKTKGKLHAKMGRSWFLLGIAARGIASPNRGYTDGEGGRSAA